MYKTVQIEMFFAFFILEKLSLPRFRSFPVGNTDKTPVGCRRRFGCRLRGRQQIACMVLEAGIGVCRGNRHKLLSPSPCRSCSKAALQSEISHPS